MSELAFDPNASQFDWSEANEAGISEAERATRMDRNACIVRRVWWDRFQAAWVYIACEMIDPQGPNPEPKAPRWKLP